MNKQTVNAVASASSLRVGSQLCHCPWPLVLDREGCCAARTLTCRLWAACLDWCVRGTQCSNTSVAAHAGLVTGACIGVTEELHSPQFPLYRLGTKPSAPENITNSRRIF